MKVLEIKNKEQLRQVIKKDIPCTCGCCGENLQDYEVGFVYETNMCPKCGQVIEKLIIREEMKNNGFV